MCVTPAHAVSAKQGVPVISSAHGWRLASGSAVDAREVEVSGGSHMYLLHGRIQKAQTRGTARGSSEGGLSMTGRKTQGNTKSSGRKTRSLEGAASMLANYVARRRECPNEAPIVGGLKWFRETRGSFVWKQINAYPHLRVSEKLLADVLVGDPRAISELSLGIMEQLMAREQVRVSVTAAVASGHAIGDALVNCLTTLMLDAVRECGIAMPPDLRNLIGYQLGGFREYARQKEAEDSFWIGQAVFRRVLGAELNNEKISNRAISKELGLHPSRVTRGVDRKEIREKIIPQLRPPPIGGSGCAE
jgi:hypothetical protein